jgi:hypothetical protein
VERLARLTIPIPVGHVRLVPALECPRCDGAITAEMWHSDGFIYSATCLCGTVFTWREGDETISVYPTAGR